MRPAALLGIAPLFASHALAACSGMNTADQGACPANQCSALNERFSSSNVLVSSSSYSPESDVDASFVSEQFPDFATIKDGNLVLSLKQSSGSDAGSFAGATAYFTRWIHYGTVTARIKSGSTADGVISSLQLQDDAGSSIDLDWVGISSNRAQANYYTNSQMQLSQAAAPVLPVDPTKSFVEYKIVWLPDSLTWYANGFAVRTVRREETWAEGEQKFHYPDKPARLSFSIWQSSSSINPAMTQQWAGSFGPQQPGSEFQMLVNSVSVQCYSNSSSLVNTAHNVNSLDGDTKSSDQKQQNTPIASSKSAVINELSNFGLASSESSQSSDGEQSSESSLAPLSGDSSDDDLSKWLAGLNSPFSSSSCQHKAQGLVASLIVACGIALISSI
ncbi:putative glycosidase CRH2 [Coemansia sp. RSA 2598]|nr:putative glycosidase CRH2 [Coemansia sp. RSA 2598]